MSKTIYAKPSRFYPGEWGVYLVGKTNKFGEPYCVACCLTKNQADNYILQNQGKLLSELPTS